MTKNPLQTYKDVSYAYIVFLYLRFDIFLKNIDRIFGL